MRAHPVGRGSRQSRLPDDQDQPHPDRERRSPISSRRVLELTNSVNSVTLGHEPVVNVICDS